MVNDEVDELRSEIERRLQNVRGLVARIDELVDQALDDLYWLDRSVERGLDEEVELEGALEAVQAAVSGYQASRGYI